MRLPAPANRGRFWGTTTAACLLLWSWSLTLTTMTMTTAFTLKTSRTLSFVVPQKSSSKTALFSSSSPTRLYYRDDKHDEGNSEGGEKQKQQQQKSQHQNQPINTPASSSSSSSSASPPLPRAPPAVVWTIPVLGPFPGQSPLVLGADMTLHPPTPMQWQALEEAVLIHQQHTTNCNNHDTESCVSDEEPDDATLSCCSAAGIDAAPLVAILDDATGSNPNGMLQVHGPPGRPIRARYATICAVVGMSSSGSGGSSSSSSSSSSAATLGTAASADDSDDGTSSSKFMNRLRQTPAEQASIVDRTIRLVAIGRAAVHSFVYQVPTSSLQNTMDEEGHLILDEKSMKQESEEDDDDDDDDDDETVPPLPTNIVMAQFQLITDRAETTTTSSSSQPNAAILPSRHASPLHALSKMSALSNQIAYLHHDRRKIVAGLQAAQARLQQRRAQQHEPEHAAAASSIVFEEELFDYDGIGALFAQKDMTTTTESENDIAADPAVLHDFLAEFGVTAASSTAVKDKEDRLVDLSDTGNEDDNELLLDPVVMASSDDDDDEKSNMVAVEPETTIGEKESEQVSLVASLENYGMGCSASSISSIPDLTQAWMDQLAPYYSPTRQQSEEHYYEVLSFVALRSMDHYLEAPHFAWAVQCTNTIERLQVVREWMTSHVQLLKEEAQRISQKLLDCGEECTDLF